jgi:hypothetical protein
MCFRTNRISNGNCKEHSEGQNVLFSHSIDHSLPWAQVFMKTPPALGKAAVQAWYDEMRFGGYDFDSQQGPTEGPTAQNFAQIVWESTTHMGAVLA